MKCETVKLPGDGTAIVCSPRRRARRCQVRGCERLGLLQCDFPTAPGETCDRYLCADHAVPQGPNLDYCPDHPRALNGALTEDDLADIRRRHAKGTQTSGLAARFGVSRRTIDAIVQGRPWRHLAERAEPAVGDLFGGRGER